jgi:hypothetical protein
LAVWGCSCSLDRAAPELNVAALKMMAKMVVFIVVDGYVGMIRR